MCAGMREIVVGTGVAFALWVAVTLFGWDTVGVALLGLGVLVLLWALGAFARLVMWELTNWRRR